MVGRTTGGGVVGSATGWGCGRQDYWVGVWSAGLLGGGVVGRIAGWGVVSMTTGCWQG